ncbi:hypothetical protein CIG19_05135 [Enterobacterales bacterium CwR94]|nr:hypothetical protein CIG19_05135 [Enterobacterales bacterium CwR94]
MPTPAHLWLTDENGSTIVGGCNMPTRLGSIELKSLRHNINIFFDFHIGKLTGTRTHCPIVIEKEFDLTTLLLLLSLCEGRILKRAILKMYRISDADIEIARARCFLPDRVTS